MFRPYSLTSIAAWTAGSLAGNHAYYSAKEKRVLPGVVENIAEHYEAYAKWGGHLDVTSWLEENKKNMALDRQEIARREMQMLFKYRDLPMEEQAMKVLTQLNIVFRIQHLPPNNDFCDDQMLFDTWNSFLVELIKLNGGEMTKAEFEQATNTTLPYLRLSIERLQQITGFFRQRVGELYGEPRPSEPKVAPSKSPKWDRVIECDHCGSRVGYSNDERGSTFTCKCGGEVLLR